MRRNVRRISSKQIRMWLKLLKNVRLKKEEVLESGIECEKKEERFAKAFNYR